MEPTVIKTSTVINCSKCSKSIPMFDPIYDHGHNVYVCESCEHKPQVKKAVNEQEAKIV